MFSSENIIEIDEDDDLSSKREESHSFPDLGVGINLLAGLVSLRLTSLVGPCRGLFVFLVAPAVAGGPTSLVPGLRGLR